MLSRCADLLARDALGHGVLSLVTDRSHWHVALVVDWCAGSRARSNASADGSADAHRVAGGDGEHATTLSRESNGSRDHGGSLDGDQDLSTRARIVAVVVLTVARTVARLPVVMVTTGLALLGR